MGLHLRSRRLHSSVLLNAVDYLQASSEQCGKPRLGGDSALRRTHVSPLKDEAALTERRGDYREYSTRLPVDLMKLGEFNERAKPH